MDWKTWYQEHLCPPQQAVRRIRSGDRVVVAHATGEPSLLLDGDIGDRLSGGLSRHGPKIPLSLQSFTPHADHQCAKHIGIGQQSGQNLQGPL